MSHEQKDNADNAEKEYKEMMTTLLSEVAEKQATAAFEAFASKMPWKVYPAIQFLATCFGGPQRAIMFLGFGITNDVLEIQRDGVRFEGGVPEEPEDGDEIHLGPNWSPTLEAFGAKAKILTKKEYAEAHGGECEDNDSEEGDEEPSFPSRM